MTCSGTTGIGAMLIWTGINQGRKGDLKLVGTSIANVLQDQFPDNLSDWTTI